MAMAEPNWLTIKGGKCDNQHIGLYQIFGVGHHSAKQMNGEHLGFCCFACWPKCVNAGTY